MKGSTVLGGVVCFALSLSVYTEAQHDNDYSLPETSFLPPSAWHQRLPSYKPQVRSPCAPAVLQ